MKGMAAKPATVGTMRSTSEAAYTTASFNSCDTGWILLRGNSTSHTSDTGCPETAANAATVAATASGMRSTSPMCIPSASITCTSQTTWCMVKPGMATDASSCHSSVSTALSEVSRVIICGGFTGDAGSIVLMDDFASECALEVLSYVSTNTYAIAVAYDAGTPNAGSHAAKASPSSLA